MVVRVSRVHPFEQRADIGGTPGYRAPETRQGFADLVSDVYSAGCILASLVLNLRTACC